MATGVGSTGDSEGEAGVGVAVAFDGLEVGVGDAVGCEVGVAIDEGVGAGGRADAVGVGVGVGAGDGVGVETRAKGVRVGRGVGAAGVGLGVGWGCTVRGEGTPSTTGPWTFGFCWLDGGNWKPPAAASSGVASAHQAALPARRADKIAVRSRCGPVFAIFPVVAPVPVWARSAARAE